MKNYLQNLLDANAAQSIESAHRLQKSLYGVCEPPSLRQLISLRHLLISTGLAGDVKSEELLGLSKTECKLLLKKLNSIYIAQRRKRHLSEVEPDETAAVQM